MGAKRKTHGGKRKGAGRPKTRRAETALVRVSRESAEKLRAIAEETGCSMSRAVDFLLASFGAVR